MPTWMWLRTRISGCELLRLDMNMNISITDTEHQRGVFEMVSFCYTLYATWTTSSMTTIDDGERKRWIQYVSSVSSVNQRFL
jgi:hypothetical protein